MTRFDLGQVQYIINTSVLILVSWKNVLSQLQK